MQMPPGPQQALLPRGERGHAVISPSWRSQTQQHCIPGPLRHLHKEAVSSGEHPLGVDQRAPANVGGAEVQTDLPRPLALWGQCPSHDPPRHGPQSTVWGEAEETICELCFSQSPAMLPGPRAGLGSLVLRAPTHPWTPLCSLNLIHSSRFLPKQSSHMVVSFLGSSSGNLDPGRFLFPRTHSFFH